MLATMPFPPAATDADADTHAAEIDRLNAALELTNRQLRRTVLELERMQALLLSTLQSLTLGVLAVGRDGVVMLANPAACHLLRRPLAELAGRTLGQVLPLGQPGLADLPRALHGTAGAQQRAQWPQAGPEGPRLLDLLAVRALPPYDEHLAGLVLLEDVTALRELEQQAQRTSRLTGMGEIAMNLAHEIRNPLGSIALFASTLARDLEAHPALGPLAAQIVGGVNALEHLVANTLEFSRPRRMALSRISLRDVLRDALLFVRHPLEQKRITVQFDHDLAPEAWIAADGEQLRQVFLNLFINALQAMFEGGELIVQLHGQPNGGWQVVVTDDGLGIPGELLPRVFDPFFTTREKGSGLGLAIVHNILSAHQAQITLESRVAAGTTVRVTFPAAVA